MESKIINTSTQIINHHEKHLESFLQRNHLTTSENDLRASVSTLGKKALYPQGSNTIHQRSDPVERIANNRIR